MKSLGRILKWTAVVLGVAFILIQLVPVTRSNPPVKGELRASPDAMSVLRRSCYDCHSNQTVWPWYSRVAPVSWLVVHDVNEGRAELNFSAWDQLPSGKQAKAMRESWKEVTEGEMPTWYYVVLHPEARLSAADKSVLQTWSASAGPVAEGEKDNDD